MMSSCIQFDSPINVFMLDLKKCAALMYAPLTLGEDPTDYEFFMESDYQSRLGSKDITSNIDGVSVLFEGNTEYELKMETFTLIRGQIFIDRSMYIQHI